MRDHTTPIFRDLTSSGVAAVGVTAGTSATPVTFNFSGVPAVSGDMRNYLQNIHIHVSTVLTTGASGSAVNADKLYKVLQSARLFSPLLGEVYPASMTRGPVLGHIIQVLAAGYQYPQPARAQIPANTAGTTTVDLFFCLPLSFEFLCKPHEVSQWVGFFDQGLVEATIDVASALGGDYAGATIGATTVRAFAEMLPSPDVSIGVPFQWRERLTPGGGNQHLLKSVGLESNLIGVETGCGLFAMALLANPTGIGLQGGGPVSDISAISIPWRSQQGLNNLDGYFLAARKLAGNRVGPIAGNGSTLLHDGGGWPFALDAVVNGRPSANAGAMFLPLILPGREFETSKAQRVAGDLPVDLTYTTTPSANGRFVTGELLEFTEQRLAALAGAMGVDTSTVVADRKALRKNSPDPTKLRYTRVTFKSGAEA